MRIAFFLIALALFIPAAHAEHYDVFLLAGQSNMDGRGKVSDLKEKLAPFKNEQEKILFTYSNSGTKGAQLASDGWITLAPGYSVRPGKPKIEKLPGETFGPEIGFAHALAQSFPAHIAIIKFAEGGTSLKTDWRLGDQQAIYARMIAFTKKRLEELKARGDTYTVRGFVWHQGESDAALSDNEYEMLLEKLITAVRTDLQSPHLPVVIGEVYDNGQRNAVLAAERGTAKKMDQVVVAPANGLKTQDEGTHFDAASQIEIGRRMADAMLPFLK